VEIVVKQKAEENRQIAKRFNSQYDRTYMAPKHKRMLNKSLADLKKSKADLLEKLGDGNLARSALDRNVNTFTPYKLHLLQIAKKNLDVAKIGNKMKSNVLRKSINRQASAPTISTVLGP